MLGWTAPPELLHEGSIDLLSYGSLFHETAEAFYRTYGSAFFNSSRTLSRIGNASATRVSDERFSEFLETYPLVGADVQRAQRERLHAIFMRCSNRTSRRTRCLWMWKRRLDHYRLQSAARSFTCKGTSIAST